MTQALLATPPHRAPRFRHQLLAIDDHRWAEYVLVRDEAEVFHLPVWSRLLEDCFGGRAMVVAALDDQDRLVGGVPLLERRTLSGRPYAACLPFTDLCRPLVDAPEIVRGLEIAIDEERQARGWTAVTLGWPAQLANARPACAVFRHVTPLRGDSEQLFATLHPGQVRRNINCARSLGLEAHVASSWREMRQFYRLHVLTRSRQGSLVEPLRYFRMLWERVIEAGLGTLLLVRDGSEVVAGGVFLQWNGNAFYKFGASDPAALKSRPNHLLLWCAMEAALRSGARSFDWGLSPDGGLRDFKRRWGADETPYHLSVLSDAEPVRSRILPYLFTAVLRTPPAFCRISGELLYRSVA